MFKATREYIALLGKELAANAWISPTAGHPLQGSGLDPKQAREKASRSSRGSLPHKAHGGSALVAAYPMASSGVHLVVMDSSTFTRASPRRPRYQPVRGAHIYVERDLYSHHGIDCGDGTVIDFAGQGGGKETACIRRATLAEFAQGAPIQTRSYGSRYSPEVIVARAASMTGQSGYDLFSNNCEHFATWCVIGAHSSAQVEAVWSTAGIVGVGAVAPRIGRDAVVGLGGTAPRSASNVMSGLTKLGGSAIGGVTVVAGAGAVVGAGTMMLALRDKPYLTDQERTARRAGRVAGVGGAAIGACAAAHSVGALGVAGYSAAGLSSGLATLGGLAGGGMVAGVAVVAAIPLLAAVAFALLAYGLVKFLNMPALALGAGTL